MLRWLAIVGCLMGGAVRADPPAALRAGMELAQLTADFQDWALAFRPRALAQGISPTTFEAAFRGLTPLPTVLEKDRNQAEFVKPIWDYLDAAVSPERVAGGIAALDTHRDLLARIEDAFGVEREVVVAIWGLESRYGANRGDIPVIAGLATLAHDGRRAAFFEGQLLAALRILQQGDVTADLMRGSWAGAMGHTQFIPTSYLAHAVDFTGDGRRDIWGDDPSDALASAAAYLTGFGWRSGQPWGMEVALPPGFDFAQSGKTVVKSAAEWNALGLRTAQAGAVPDHGPARLLLPAGAGGAAFLIFGNFAVIERYNAADAYVIAVGHLADRLRGGPGVQAAWPRGDRALLFAERVELQQRLTSAGFDTGGADGRIGPKSVAALRAYQASIGVPPDGYASPDMLDRLR